MDDSRWHLEKTVNQLHNLITNHLPFIHAMLASLSLCFSVFIREYFMEKSDKLPFKVIDRVLFKRVSYARLVLLWRCHAVTDY